MNIEVKGINDILIMKLNQDCEFKAILDELNMLLDQPIFMQDGFYPRAFFDCGSRHLQNNELTELLGLLKEKQKILFDGISIPYSKNELAIYRQQLRNGEEIHIFNETLFLGTVNPGSYVYCHDNVYFLNTIRGNVVLFNENVKIYGHAFKKAQIYINQSTLHDLTTYALTSVYYKDGSIVVKKEDGYEQDNCHYIG